MKEYNILTSTSIYAGNEYFESRRKVKDWAYSFDAHGRRRYLADWGTCPTYEPALLADRGFTYHFRQFSPKPDSTYNFIK